MTARTKQDIQYTGQTESHILSDKTITTVSEITVVLCRLAIGITGLSWFISGDGLRFSVAIIALLLTVLPMRFIHDSLLRNATAVVISLLLAANIVFGMQYELYETSKLYDKAMHLLGSGAIAGILIVAIHTYCDRCRIKLPLALFAILVSAGTLSLGTLWEFFEFGIDSTGLFNAQRGLHDTMLDLLADAIGAVLAISLFVTMNWSQEQLRKRRTRDLIMMGRHSSAQISATRRVDDSGIRAGDGCWNAGVQPYPHRCTTAATGPNQSCHCDGSEQADQHPY